MRFVATHGWRSKSADKNARDPFGGFQNRCIVAKLKTPRLRKPDGEPDSRERPALIESSGDHARDGKPDLTEHTIKDFWRSIEGVSMSESRTKSADSELRVEDMKSWQIMERGTRGLREEMASFLGNVKGDTVGFWTRERFSSETPTKSGASNPLDRVRKIIQFFLYHRPECAILVIRFFQAEIDRFYRTHTGFKNPDAGYGKVLTHTGQLLQTSHSGTADELEDALARLTVETNLLIEEKRRAEDFAREERTA